jgi:tetratricopeptide (TPR) repeat protein
MAQEAPAPPDAAPSPAPGPSVDRSAAEALRERILKRVDELLRERRERILEEVKRVLDEELRRAAEARKAEAPEGRDRLADAVGRLDGLVKRLRDLRESVERARARAEQALRGAEGPARPEPDDTPKRKAAAAAEIEIPPAFRALEEAMSRYGAGEYEKAIESFTDAAKGLASIRTPVARLYRTEALYRIACCHAVLGRPDDALQSLERAVRGGFRQIDKMEEDAELDPVREDPRFDRLMRLARSLRG